MSQSKYKVGQFVTLVIKSDTLNSSVNVTIKSIDSSAGIIKINEFNNTFDLDGTGLDFKDSMSGYIS